MPSAEEAQWWADDYLILVYALLALARLLLKDRWVPLAHVAVLGVLAQLVFPLPTLSWLMLPTFFCDVLVHKVAQLTIS